MKHETYRLIEIASILVFFITTVALIIVNPSPGVGVVEDIPSSDGIEAYAYAMPLQGWAPLTVYFSPFGSNSRLGKVVKYEWDLDANGRYETDATDNSGYASYIYKKSGAYKITLKVTDEHGNIATSSVTVTVRYPASSSVDYWTIFDDNQIRRVQLRLTQTNWDRMWQELPAKTRVEADVVTRTLER